MPLLDDRHQRAGVIIIVLGIALAIALFPFATGLLAIPVFEVIFRPLFRLLRRGMRPAAAAGIVVALGVVIVLVPLASLAGVVVNEAQGVASGVIQSPVLARLSDLRIGQVAIGPHLADLGRRVIEWVGTSAFGLVGAATRLVLNLAISFFGLFYLLQNSGQVWAKLVPYIPFSTVNAERLRYRFEGVTISTVIGTGLTALIQGTLVGLGFMVAGLPNALFWGVITLVFAILPVVGSGLVWGPGVLALALDQRYGAAIGLALWGGVVVANIDNVIRPMVFRRWANIHPLITIVGAFGGVRYFGLLGLLIGPLALSYFFELLRMYREEYMDRSPVAPTA